ncbi:unnamed protein product [Polarella glacialis]|uniref:Uncharacterized protein n=1 Tax=Polarella glacialis TaxID=89957 RepID=A0A813GAM3_POLGL|nr:unnamed protein product [Polarella glacialis]
MPSSSRRQLGASTLLAVLSAKSSSGFAALPLFPPPRDAESQPQWLGKLTAWKEQVRREINYTGGIYDDPAVNWTRLSYVQPQTHLYDRYLYDPVKHEYTVDRYMDDVTTRYGGIDSILLWPTYTNLGIDDRNQFDYFRALPGGLSGLQELTAQFHKRGVHVLWAYNPWDHGTRNDPRMAKSRDSDQRSQQTATKQQHHKQQITTNL